MASHTHTHTHTHTNTHVYLTFTHKNYVTGSWKTGLIATITDIHFLPVLESCTHALPMQKHQALDHRWPGMLLRTAFYRCCQTTRVHFMALEGFNKTAWGAIRDITGTEKNYSKNQQHSSSL